MKNKRLIIGFHAINARLWQNPASVYEIYVLDSKNNHRTREIIQKAQCENVKVHIIDGQRIEAIAGQTKHQGVIAFIDATYPFITVEDILYHLEEPPLLLMLDGITDPHNLGAILRVANAMGVHAVIAPKNNSVGLNATVSKVACGADATVPYITVTNLVRTMKELKKRKIWIYGTQIATNTDNIISLYEIDLPYGIIWVMGSEDRGMRRLTQENCDRLVSIPMCTSAESLNVSVSAGIVLSETRRQYATRLKENG